MSFKQKLHNLILKNKNLSTYELEQFCKQEEHKMSYAERELRRLMQESPYIKATRNNKGAIIGYYYDSQDFCGYCNYYITHRADCPLVTSKQPKTLF